MFLEFALAGGGNEFSVQFYYLSIACLLKCREIFKPMDKNGLKESSQKRNEQKLPLVLR